MPFEIVHTKTYEPGTDTDAVVVPELALPNELKPGPDSCVHTPVPTVGVFPPRAPLVRELHIFCAAPAVATVGTA